MSKRDVVAYWQITSHDVIDGRRGDSNQTSNGMQSEVSQATHCLALNLASVVVPLAESNVREWSISSKDTRGRSRRPITKDGEGNTVGWHFSLSHGNVYSAIGLSRNRRIGIDIVDRYIGKTQRLHWLFNKHEMAWINENTDHETIRSKDLNSLLIWSAKEAAFKASRIRRFDPSAIHIQTNGKDFSCQIESIHLRVQVAITDRFVMARASPPHVCWKEVNSTHYCSNQLADSDFLSSQ